MNIIRRLIIALALSAGIAPAIAQVPPPIPALPDTERRTTYSLSNSNCSCAVGFQLYGDSTDVGNWMEVFVNGTLMPQAGNWTISSPTGSLGTIPLPITDAVLTFTVPQTGTIQIIGARRPRRASQFSESSGVSARSLNQVFSDVIATQRELWDKTNDVTGRAVLAPPGETLKILPALASRQNMGACFDSGGNLQPCVAAPSGSFVAGSGITFTGTNPTTISSNFDSIYCNTIGYLIVRTTSAWTCSQSIPANPVWWGADPTGSADSTGAINSAVTATSGNIKFPCGTFKFSTLTYTTANLRFVGNGQCTYLQSTANTTGDLISYGSSGSNTDGLRVANMRIGATSAKTGGRSLFLQRVTNFVIENVSFDDHNSYNAVEIAQFSRGRLTDVYVNTCQQDGIRIYGGTGRGGAEIALDPSTLVTACVHDGVVLGGGAGGVRLENGSTVNGRFGLYTTPNLAIGGAATNREIFFGSNWGSDSNVLGGALFDNNSVALVWAAPGAEFSGSTGAGGVGIQINPQGGAAFTFSGLWLSSNNAGGIVSTDPGYLAITGGSQIQNNGHGSAADGVLINNPGAGSQTIIQGNLIEGSGTGGTGWGVRILGTVGYFNVSGNLIRGNSAGQITYPTPTGTNGCRVEGNIGFNPSGVGTIAVGASPFTYTASCSPETVYIGGGTVSNTQTAATGAGGQPIGIVSNVSVQLGPQETVTVTYTAAPTMIKAVH